jgi:hypothetical protein
MEDKNFQHMDFSETSYLGFLLQLVNSVTFFYNWTKITDTLHQDLHVSMTSCHNWPLQSRHCSLWDMSWGWRNSEVSSIEHNQWYTSRNHLWRDTDGKSPTYHTSVMDCTSVALTHKNCTSVALTQKNCTSVALTQKNCTSVALTQKNCTSVA